MEPDDPMTVDATSTVIESVPVDSPLQRAQCHAKSKQSGQRCQRPAIPGGTVCRFHGGEAPQVKQAAALRLARMVDPAIAVLAREMTSTTNKSADRIRAAENVLDRAGVPRHVETDTETARRVLVERLVALRDRVELEP